MIAVVASGAGLAPQAPERSNADTEPVDRRLLRRSGVAASSTLWFCSLARDVHVFLKSRRAEESLMLIYTMMFAMPGARHGRQDSATG